jgi:hypothetical protein
LRFVCIIYAEGAPSLRFLQGRVTMLPTQLLSFCTNPVADAVVVPALCRPRKGRGTLRFVCASEFKSLGHPPASVIMTPTETKGGPAPASPSTSPCSRLNFSSSKMYSEIFVLLSFPAANDCASHIIASLVSSSKARLSRGGDSYSQNPQ